MKYFRCTANISADSRGQSSQRNIIENSKTNDFQLA